MAVKDFELPTQFTQSQLEKLRMLARVESSKRPDDRDLHNLGRKLDEYCSQVHRAARPA